MNYRLLATVAILCSIIFLPYYVYVPALFLGAIIFPVYWESLLLSFLIETLYGEGIRLTLATLALLIILLPLRERLRLYA